jgi:hypothetical protein
VRQALKETKAGRLDCRDGCCAHEVGVLAKKEKGIVETYAIVSCSNHPDTVYFDIIEGILVFFFHSDHDDLDSGHL